jgi:hypothetical protein
VHAGLQISSQAARLAFSRSKPPFAAPNLIKGVAMIAPIWPDGKPLGMVAQ